MVLLILTRSGFEDIRSRVDPANDAIWVSNGVLSAEEVATLRRSGLSLTTFAHQLDPANLDSDLATVIEHHPEQTVWIEALRHW